MVVDDMAREDGNVFRCSVILGVGQPGRIGVVGVLHTKLCRLAVHHLGKTIHRAAKIFRQGDSRIVAGLDNQPLQQILHKNLFVHFDKHT